MDVNVKLSAVLRAAVLVYRGDNVFPYGDLPSSIDTTETLLKNVADVANAGHKIQMIKAVRLVTGWGLREAKVLVDNCVAYEPAPADEVLMRNVFPAF